MSQQPDRTIKILLALLVVGVWALVLRPLVAPLPVHAQSPQLGSVGRYTLQRDSSGFWVLDTTTGTIKWVFLSSNPSEATTLRWDNNYLHGNEVKGPLVETAHPENKQP